MRTSPWPWTWLCLAAAACNGRAREPASAPGVVSVSVATVPTASGTPTAGLSEIPGSPASLGDDARATSAAGDASGESAARALIDAGGVGVFRLGARVAEGALGAEPERRFFARSIADLQEIEGFRIAGVPLSVAVRPRMGSAAHSLSLAKQGRLMVSALYVDGPGPATARGAGVGSRLADLERLYGSVAAHDVPPTWGHDECAASVPELADVWFYFESCEGECECVGEGECGSERERESEGECGSERESEGEGGSERESEGGSVSERRWGECGGERERGSEDLRLLGIF